MTHTISVIRGDGIGPEIMDANLRVLEATGLDLNFEFVEAGRKVFERGDVTGVPDETIESIRRTGVALKSPLATENGRSANVNLRRQLDLFANVRPAKSIPGIELPLGTVDLVVVRENSEDLYVGEERFLAPGEVKSIKTTTDRAAEMIARVAFELAKLQGRDSVLCVAKRNILQLGDRMFSDAFDRVAKEYDGIKPGYLHVDALSEKLVLNPRQLGIMVMNNLFGDVMSDLTAGLIGGLGVAPSGNFGANCAMFEAVHGTADSPNGGIAGKDVANPTALMLSTELMLRYLGEKDAADKIRNAIFALYEQREFRTRDKMIEGAKEIGTSQFAKEVIWLMEQNRVPASGDAALQNLSLPNFSSISYQGVDLLPSLTPVGADVEIVSTKSPKELYQYATESCSDAKIKLKAIACRGGVVSKEQDQEPGYPTLYTLRFISEPDVQVSISELFLALNGAGKVVGHQMLQRSGTKRMYSLFQGERDDNGS